MVFLKYPIFRGYTKEWPNNKVALNGYWLISMLQCYVLLSGYSRPKLNCKDHYGQSYEGTVSQTRSGRTCQAWNTTYPHSHGYVLPLSAENFCRNPDDQPLGPWCYTVDQEERYGFCDVKNCAGKIVIDFTHATHECFVCKLCVILLTTALALYEGYIR